MAARTAAADRPAELHADRRWMSKALELARRGLHTTDPNPRVGCLLVKDEECAGSGWHRRAGKLTRKCGRWKRPEPGPMAQPAT